MPSQNKSDRDSLAQFAAAMEGCFDTAPKLTISRTGEYSFHATIIGYRGPEVPMEQIEDDLGIGWMVTTYTIGTTPTNLPIIGVDAEFVRPWMSS